MNKKYYDVGFSQLVLNLLPPMLYKDIAIAFVSAALYPLAQLHKSFVQYIAKVDTSVNSQVCYMQAILNDKYDYYERRIVVRDSIVNETDFFLFDEGKGNAAMTYDMDGGDAVMWVDDGFLGSTQIDFEIVFPRGYEFSDNEYRALVQFVNNNKLASKRFKIVYA